MILGAILHAVRKRVSAAFRPTSDRRPVRMYRIYVAADPMTYFADRGDERIIADFLVRALRQGEQTIVVEATTMSQRQADLIPGEQMLDG
jgi:hypothetical protein